MSILQQVDKMQTILRPLSDQAAVETGMVKRNRKLTGSALTQILVFGWLENPEASYHELLKLLVPWASMSRAKPLRNVSDVKPLRC